MGQGYLFAPKGGVDVEPLMNPDCPLTMSDSVSGRRLAGEARRYLWDCSCGLG